MIIYHVTPTANLQSILEQGVSPKFSRGKLPACWYVSTPQTTLWAIAHVSARHHVDANMISVFVIETDFSALKYTRWMYVYTCAVALNPGAALSAVEVLSASLLEVDQRIAGLFS
jgi:hypothetical protein